MKNNKQKLLIFIIIFLVWLGDNELAYQYYYSHFDHNKSFDAYNKMLRNVAYIGIYKRYRKDEYIHNYIPRLMSDELFYSVQNILDKRRRKTKDNRELPFSLFDGILKCSECGASFSRKLDKRPNKIYISYRCWKTQKYSGEIGKKWLCNNKDIIYENILENYLIDNVKIEINKYIENNKKNIENANIQANQKTIKDNSKNIRSKLEKLKDLYMDNLIDKNTYKKDYLKLTQQLDEITLSKTQNIVNNDYSQLKKILDMDFTNIYKNLTPIKKRRFWLDIIDVIYIKNKTVENIIFK